MVKKISPVWDNIRVWEVSGKGSVHNNELGVIVVTMIYDSYEQTDFAACGRITWEDLKDLVKGNIMGVFSTDITELFILTKWESHTINDGCTIYGRLSTNGIIFEKNDDTPEITPGLLKALTRKHIDERRVVEKPEDLEQLKCEQKHSKGRKRETKDKKRGYIAWRSRVF